MTYTYTIIQYRNKPYSDNTEHHGSVALTDAQHEIKWVKNYYETLKTILHYNDKDNDLVGRSHSGKYNYYRYYLYSYMKGTQI